VEHRSRSDESHGERGHPEEARRVNVLVAGGGTAGHVFPALALARRLAAAGADVRFAGTPTGQEAALVPAAGFPFEPIDARPLRRELSVETVSAPITAARSVARCRPLVERADVVVGMGGYVSVPVGLAAIRARRPLVLHEQNAIPGLANRLLARRAHTVALTFAEARAAFPRRARTVVTGDPVRESILTVADERERLTKEAYEEFELDPSRRTLVVFGGSQGALHVDVTMVDALHFLRDRGDLQVLLLTGPAHEERVRRTVGEPGDIAVRVVGFLDRMELAYAAAHLVLARAGATTCAEITVCGLPSILVPYPHATAGHQEANARALERAGAAVVVLDADISGEVVAREVTALLDDEDRRRSMGERARAWSRPDAADALAAEVSNAVGGG
jgi:UDP-N-acetylglucosamine--N-acetylmuramyl-(pentapeptide) pyrophosphoryl-undecaprenol N-acetylglucosamine transferase